MSVSIQSYEHFIAITDRSLCRGSFTDQVRRVCSRHPFALILREKDLPDRDYRQLAIKIRDICTAAQVRFFVHGRPEVARQMECSSIHLPLSVLRALGGKRPEGFAPGHSLVSVSCHSMEDMREAVAAGADLIILGTIFETQCKKGLRGRGVSFVKEICDACPVPVYAIGGIKENNIDLVMQAGAAGGCMMSGFMQM